MIVKALALILLLTAGYLCWWATQYADPVWYVGAVVLTFSGTGLLLKRVWAKYLWYAIGSGVSAIWLVTILRLALNGWPVAGKAETVISLIPGALLLLVCVGGILAVRRDFRQA
jgi:hypothetical protein